MGILLAATAPGGEAWAGPLSASSTHGGAAHARASFLRPHLVTYRRRDVPIRPRSSRSSLSALVSGTPISRVAAPADGPVLSTWQVTYTGFDGALNPQGPAARVAFQAAVDIWSHILTSSVPIKVDASFTALPPGNLGSAGASANYPGVGDKQSFYASALADAVSGVDQSTQFAGAPSSDIIAEFQSSPAAGFYFGTDGAPPAGAVDFESVVLHELGHGVGFAGSMEVDAATGVGSWLGPERFDRFTSDASSEGTRLLEQANHSSALAAKLRSDAVYWNGPQGVAADGGLRPRLYAPAGWQQGSSFAHLDEQTYGLGNANSLMTPSISAQEVIHSPGALAVGMLADEGWQASLPSAASSGPVVSIGSGPTGATTERSASVSFTGSDVAEPAAALSYSCSLDGKASPCTSPVSYPTLTDGEHALQIVATDQSGTTGAPVTLRWVVDSVAPSVASSGLPVFSLAGAVALRYQGLDDLSGVASYDVRVRVAPYNSGFGGYLYPAPWQGTTSAASTISTTPGSTYCLSVRSRDRAGNLSGWSGQRCTAVALDDRSLTATPGWARGTAAGNYRSTATTAARLGVVLTRTGVQARRLSLVARRCLGCGTVGIYWNGALIKRVSLAAASTSYRQMLPIVDFGTTRTGTVTVRTLSAGTVSIDGLASSRA